MAISSADEIRTAVDHPGAIILDVRTKEEIAAAPFTKKPYKQAKCSLDDCSELIENAETLMPDKNGRQSSLPNLEFSCIMMANLISCCFRFLSHHSSSCHFLPFGPPRWQSKRSVGGERIHYCIECWRCWRH